MAILLTVVLTGVLLTLSLVKTSFLCANGKPTALSPRALFIPLLLAGCLVLLIQGAWDLAKYQAEMRKEKIRLEQLSAEGFEVTGMKSEIRIKIYLSAAMAIAGAFGLFVYISRSTRKQTDHSKTVKHKKNHELHR